MHASAPPIHPAPRAAQRALAATGAVLAALSVGLAAYAAHAADDAARATLQMAAMFGFGHGIALASLASTCRRRLGIVSLAALLLGVLLFSGSLVAGQLLGLSTRLAPMGGSLMILAWLGLALDLGRR